MESKTTIGDAFQLIDDLKEDSIDLVLADPIYDLTAKQQNAFHEKFKRVCKKWIIIFCKPENQWAVEPTQYLFWVKPISTKNTSKSYSRFVEMILVYSKGHWEPGRHWSQYTNVFTDLVDSKVHPFRKPPSLIERLILNHSKPGDTILDPFAGSGVVEAVGTRLGRNVISFEIEESKHD